MKAGHLPYNKERIHSSAYSIRDSRMLPVQTVRTAEDDAHSKPSPALAVRLPVHQTKPTPADESH